MLDRIGGVQGMDPNGETWYCNTKEIEALTGANCPQEVLWRGQKSQSNSLESDNYPPSIYGNGRVNPTQNFVNAFPMANGYPISMTSESKYDAANPYNGRDPRLAKYVLLNGSTQGSSSAVIETCVDGSTKDALDNLTGSSTRTGYYLRKLLRSDINLDPKSTSKQYHYNPYIRYTEMFLSYAEAANEAWGPKGKGTHSYSAYDVIKAIRERAGLGDADKGDAYLEECAASQDKMRELIRNERRIELSFEGFRFWDLRRWKCNLNETTQGMSISKEKGTYTVVDVDTRKYEDYMYYAPIPYSEVLKYSELKQNAGW